MVWGWWSWGRMVLLEMGFAWAASMEGWMEEPYGVPHGRALGSWRSPSSSSTDPSLGACPALLGLPWAEPWQQVLTLRQDPKNHTLGLAAST